MPRPVPMVLTDRVEVFGLAVPIDWPAGTVVEAVAFNAMSRQLSEPISFVVTGPGGVLVTLPARLLRAQHQTRVA